MIKLLDPVMGFGAGISLTALVPVMLRDHVGTDFGSIGAQRPSAVLFGFVKVEALLGVVLIGKLAGLGLEVKEVNEGD